MTRKSDLLKSFSKVNFEIKVNIQNFIPYKNVNRSRKNEFSEIL